MSAIDERVVQMTFENHLFERNVATSIGTLEKLKNALKFDRASDGLRGIETNIKKADFSSLTNAVESISDRFSNMGIIGMSALNMITSAAVKTGSDIIKFVMSPLQSAFNQIKAGGWARASNIAQAKFLLEGLEIEWEAIKPDIQKAVDQTAYGLDAAAQAAAKLAASGIEYGGELSPMYKALRGIAGLAGMTGQSYERVAYVYSQIAAAGRLMGQDLMQLNSLGINIAATIAKRIGKTEAEVREMISDGLIDFNTFSQAMYDSYAEQAGKANETYTGSLANMKAALSRIGERFATPFQQNMKDVYNSLRLMIGKISTHLEPVYEKFSGFAEKASKFLTSFIDNLDLSFVDGFVSKFEKFYIVFEKVFDTSTKAIEQAGKGSDVTSNKVTKTTEKIKKISSAVESFADKSKSLSELKKNLESVEKPLITIENMATGITKSVSAIDAARTSIEQTSQAAKESTPLENLVTILKGIGSAFNIVKEVFNSLTETIGKPVGEVVDRLLAVGASVANLVIQFDRDFKVSELFGIKKNEIEGFTDGVDEATEATKNLEEVVQAVIRGDYKNAPERFDLLSAAGLNPYVVQNKVNEVLGCLFRYEVGTEEVVEANQNAADSADKVATSIEQLTTADKISEIIRGLASAFNIAKKFAITFVNAAEGPLGRAFKAIGKYVLHALTGVARFYTALDVYLEKTGVYEKVGGIFAALFDKVASAFEKISDIGIIIFDAIIKKIQNLGTLIIEAKDKFTEFMDAFKQTEGFKKLSGFIDGVKDTLSALKDNILGKVIDLFNKFNDTTFSLNNIKLFDDNGIVMNMESFAKLVSDKVSKIVDKLQRFKNAIDDFLFVDVEGESFFDKLNRFFRSVGAIGIVDKITNAFKGFWEFLKWIFLPQTVSASTLYDDVAAPMTKTADSVEQSSSILVGVIKSIGGFIKDLSTGKLTLEGIVTTIENTIGSFLKWIYPSFDGSLDSVKGIIHDFWFFLIDWDLFKVVRKLLGRAKRQDVDTSIRGIFEELEGVVKNIKKMFGEDIPDALGRVSKAYRRNSFANLILKIAAAVGILALSFKLLSTISWDQFKVAAAAIGVITASLVALMLALTLLTRKSGGGENTSGLLDGILDPFKSSIGKFLKDFGKGAKLAGFGIAIALIVKALTTLTDIDWGAIFKGVVALGIVMVELAAGMALMNKAMSVGDGATVRQALVLVAFGLAIKMAASTYVKLGKMSLAEVNRATKLMIALALGMTAVLWATKNSKWGPLLALAGIILEVTAALLVLCAIPKGMLEKSVDALTSVFNALALFNASNLFLKNGTKDEMAEGIIGIAGLMAEIVGLFYLSKDLNPNNVKKMASAISEIMTSLALMMAAQGVFARLNGKDWSSLLKTGVILLVVTGLLAIGGFIEQNKPGLNNLLQSGIPILGTIGEGLGALIGGVLEKGLLEPLKRVFGGGETFTEKLEKFKTFITDLVETFSGDMEVNTEAVESIKGLLTAIAGAELINAIGEFIEGLTIFGAEDLSEKLGDYKDFILAMAEVFKPGEVSFDKEAASTFAEIIEAFGKGELYNSLTNFINLLNPFQAFTPSLGDNLVDFAKDVKKYAAAIDGLKTGAVTETEAAVKIVIELCKELPSTGGLLQALTGEQNFARSSFGLVGFGRKMKKYSEVIAGMDSNAVLNTETAVSTVIALCKETPKYGGWIQDIFGEQKLNNVSYGLTFFAEQMVSYSKAIEGMKTDAVTNTEAAVGSIIALANAVPNQGGLLSLIVGDNKIGDFGEGLVTFSEDVAAYAANLAGLDYEGATTVNDILRNLNDAFLEIEDNFFLSNFNYDTKADELVKGVMNIFNKFSYELNNQESYKDLEDAGRNLFDKVIAGFYSKCTDLDQTTEIGGNLIKLFEDDNLTASAKSSGESVGQEFLDGANDKLEDNKTYLNAPIDTLFGEVTKGIESKKGSIESSTDIALTGATDSINNLVNSFEISGINLMIGLANGINKGKEIATTSIKNAAVEVLLSGNRMLGINSPSTKAFESGMYFMQGFCNGIIQNKGLATNAVYNVAQSSLGVMDDTLSGYNASSTGVLNDFTNTLAATWLYIKSIADESWDTQPVISPVLDLTNIERGAGGINGILSGYNLDMNSLSGIRSAMNPYGYTDQQAGNVTTQEFTNTMKGVREDIRMLGQAVENMKLVLDTGLLVGQISSGIDRELGNRSLLLSRWAN